MDTPKAESKKEFHTIKEMSAVTGLCYRTIWRYVKAGRIRAVRMGGSIGIPAAELEKILSKGF